MGHKKLRHIALNLALLNAPVYACSYAGEWPTIDERVESATHIVLAQVDKRYYYEHFIEVAGPEMIWPAFPDTSTVHVHEWLKGQGAKNIFISGFGGGGDCKSYSPDEEAVYFLKQLENGHYQLNYLGVYDAVIDASDENLKSIVTALQTTAS